MTTTDVKTESKILGITEIKEYLPHRYPLLLVDRVVDSNWARPSPRSRTSPSTKNSSTATSRTSR
jgi:predicted hotdog family 3-hydroxylacyl-ACP dehydratase